MESQRVVSREEWLAARQELLGQEKEATRAKDAVDARRRALPVVEVDKDYVFAGPDGPASLAGLFGGRRQLIVYHFMWRHAESGFPDEDQGCPTCSFLADSIGELSHLHSCDATLVLVSRAPLASIERFRKRMGWQVPWYSSHGSDFNYDFHVTLDEARGSAEYNYTDANALKRARKLWMDELPGLSVFYREGGDVFHTYSAYQRGLDHLINTYNYVDLTPLGRHEGDLEWVQAWIRHHDRYAGV